MVRNLINTINIIITVHSIYVDPSESKDSMQKQGMVKMDCPACSPADLNPIENLLAWIKIQLNLRAPKILGGLGKDVNEIWENSTIEF